MTPALVNTPAEDWVCCFCGKTITDADPLAVKAILINLRQEYREDLPRQEVFGHSQCFAERLIPGVFFDPESFLPD